MKFERTQRTPISCYYVRSNFIKEADEKFFAELFFKKATTPARRRPHINGAKRRMTA